MPSPTPSRTPDSAPHLIAALRTATAPIHAAVERLPAMMRLTGPDPTPADYRRYLRAMAQIYGTLEPPFYAALEALHTHSVAASPTVRPAQRPVTLGLRPKYPTLCADLAAHGLPPPALEPLESPPPDLDTAVGGLYVLEGSTIGGRVVARHLRKHLGDPLLGGGFLDFHGDQASATWKGFGLALEDLAQAGLVAPDRVIAGACAVFQEVYERLATGGREHPTA